MNRKLLSEMRTLSSSTGFKMSKSVKPEETWINGGRTGDNSEWVN